MNTGNAWDIAKITLFVAGIAIFSGTVWADEANPAADRIDARGDRIEDRLDDRGDHIDDHQGTLLGAARRCQFP